MQYAALLPLVASSAILIAGVVDDIRSKKFHNWLFLACCAFALSVSLFLNGWGGLIVASLGFGAGILIPLPLVLTRVLGAGDMKLLAAFGIIAGWEAVVAVAILSLVWGAIFGVVRAFANGQGRVLVSNMFSIISMKPRENLVLHSMPYTVALLFGWMTHLVYQGVL